eukprot:TRINITY_DN35346_c0_g1_i1.p1 TRINITY_DN35346_c0_g1~~TRINITY_DN35346_c0_g1_i1.p1  ORF type:complete len:415 (-),score=52.41 TRINITY_DN35346_c0_g1_i1:237-1481(-)
MLPLTATGPYTDPSMRTMSSLSQTHGSPYNAAYGGQSPQHQQMPMQQKGFSSPPGTLSTAASYGGAYAPPGQLQSSSLPLIGQDRSFTYTGTGSFAGASPAMHQPRTTAPAYQTGKQMPQECQDQCAEEGCFEEEKVGNEDHAPTEEFRYCGIDVRPLLGPLLFVSTGIGTVHMFLLQIPLLGEITGAKEVFYSLFGVLYGILLWCILVCTFGNPGEISAETARKMAVTRDGVEEMYVPQRGKKTWLYDLPVRRYDHYCKWVQNMIGLWNHREFVTMVLGLAFIALVGLLVDAWLAIHIAKKGNLELEIGILLHLGYSCILFAQVWPIARVHIMLVSRNETANEWKKDVNCMARTAEGTLVEINTLEPDMYNELLDNGGLEYVPSKNTYDKGCFMNWITFYCNSRWSVDEMGEF